MALRNLPGAVYLRPWTPAKAAGAARRRIDKIELLLQEIGGLYGDVDQGVVDKCDALAAELRGEDSLDEAIQYALDTGAML